MHEIIIEKYSKSWPQRFETLKEQIWPHISDKAVAIEHVGSTAVPKLAAKPVIDVDIIIEDPSDFGPVREVLESLGYRHRGDRGIPQREAFTYANPPFARNLYVCVDGCLALRNHLDFRDHLRDYPLTRDAYGALKRSLARKYPYDLGAYLEGKTEFILEILSLYEMTSDEMETIERQNRTFE